MRQRLSWGATMKTHIKDALQVLTAILITGRMVKIKKSDFRIKRITPNQPTKANKEIDNE